MNVRFLDAASRDVDRISAYIADRNASAARRFPDAVAKSVDLLLRFPNAGTVIQSQIIPHAVLRRFVIKEFPRYIIYYYSKEELVIVRILHGARDRDTILRNKR